MIKYLVFILVVLFSQIEGQQIIHTETHKNGGIKLISYHKMVDGGMGISLLKEETYDLNGRKSSESYYKNGKLNGLVTGWSLNGKKGYEGKYNDGKQDGLWTEWSENGQKKRVESYNDGKQDGLSTYWYKNGQKSSEKTYKDGKFISKKEWNEDGSVKE